MLISEQLDLAGWDTAWLHEKRGRGGEWVKVDLASADDHHIAGTPYTYHHGWVLIGPVTPGEPVTHPDLGVGVISKRVGTKVNVDFGHGVKAQFEQKHDAGDLDLEAGLHRRIEPPELRSNAFGGAGGRTEGQFAAVIDYVAPEGSASINGALRRGRMPGKGTIHSFFGDKLVDRAAEVHELDGLIASNTLVKPTVLYRGMALTPALEKKLKPGAVFTDKAFSSTSDSLDWAQKFAHLRVSGGEENMPGVKAMGGKPVIVSIAVPAGAHMAGGEPDIGEFILPRGSGYHVDSVSPDGGQISLTAMPPPPAPPVSPVLAGGTSALLLAGDGAKNAARAARLAWSEDEIEFDVPEVPDADLAGVELGWRYNPLEHRNAHGEWSRDGSEAMKALSGMKWGDGKVYKAPPADRTMAGGKKASDNLFIRKYGLSAGNIVAAYDDANAAELDEGMRWYSDAHTVARMIGGGDADKGAALLSAFSPQTDWQTNAINAAHTIELGHPPEHGTGITGTVQDKARAILARDHGPYDDLFPTSAQKTNAFYKLIRNGGDAPDDEDGLVVMDRHALSVAAGRRLTKDQTDTPSYADVRTGHPDWDEDQVKAYRSTLPPAPVGSVFTYQHMADMYREAALTVSKRDGTQVSPHQMQAITWLRQQRKNNELDAALVAQGEAVVKAGGKMGTVHGAKESKGRFSRASKAWAAWEGYAAGHTIATHLGTTAIGHENPISVSNDASTISGQLDLAGGWHDAWKHELRGRHGEWGEGAGNGLLEEGASRTAKPAKPDYSHVLAQLALARSHPDAYPVYMQMIDGAMNALDDGKDHEAKQALRLLADFAVRHPSGMGTGSKTDALFFRNMSAEVTKQAAKVQPKTPKPKLAPPTDAELSKISDSVGWLYGDASAHGRKAGEVLALRNAVGAIEMHRKDTGTGYGETASEWLLKAARVADTDPNGGLARAEQYRGLANRVHPGAYLPPPPEIAAVHDFLNKNAAAVPAMLGQGLALNWDGKPPTGYAPNVHPGYLAQMDWNGHMSIQDERARRIQAIMSGTGPVDDPDAPTVVLHEMIHQVMPAADVPPAGATDRADMAAYQVEGVQAIEEGFTQHGTALHAREFFEHAGIADRKTKFLADPDAISPEWKDARREGVAALLSASDRLYTVMPSADRSDAMDAIEKALAQLGQDDPYAMGNVIFTLSKVAKTDKTGHLAKEITRITDRMVALTTTPSGDHFTMGEYANKMALPHVLKQGSGWPHYANWTAKAQEFGETIAELGGNNARQSDVQDEVRRVSDAVNSVGAAKKSHVMAELTMEAAGLGADLTPRQRDAALSSMEATIEAQWLAAGPDKAARLAARQARQQIQSMKMAEAA